MWGLENALLSGLTIFGDTSSAITAMREYVMPVVQLLAGLASVACVFFIANAGYLYITSSGKSATRPTEPVGASPFLPLRR